MNEETKAIVSVSEMARMCGLSRARFYQLQKAGIFPFPVYEVSNRRPIYDELMQKVCLEVRRRNCGVNGKPILFYARRHQVGLARPKWQKVKTRQPKRNSHSDMIESLQALGLANVIPTQVEEALRTLYPQGTAGIDPSEIIRSVFLLLRRKN